MTLPERLKRIVAGEVLTLKRTDVAKIVNHVKSQNKEIRRLSELKNADIEITIIDL